MNRREQWLAKTVGVLVGVLALYQMTQWMIVSPFRTLNRDLERARGTRQSLDLMSRRESRADADWSERVQMTLATDPVQAANIFRRDIEGLLKTHHLDRDGVVQSNAPRTAKNGLTEVPLSVTAKGGLADVVGFLRDFYRRPYLAQMARLTLNAGDSKPRDSKESPNGKTVRKDKPSEVISLEMSVVTLVLPAKGGVKASPLGSLEALRDRVNEDRLAKKEPGEYDRIASANVFGWPVPPVMARADPTPTSLPVKSDTPAEIKVDRKKPDPPRSRERVIVCGVASTNGEYEVFVRHEGKNDQPPKLYRLNDEFDGGRIVLIHPMGIVVRRQGHGDSRGGDSGVETRGGDSHDMFYPLGMSSEDRERERPPVPPEVADDLEIALGVGE